MVKLWDKRKVGPKGKVVLPLELRNMFRIEEDDEILFIETDWRDEHKKEFYIIAKLIKRGLE